MATGSEKLDQIVERLKGTADPKRRYEYVLWLAKKLQPLPDEFRNDAFKVKGCVSQVYVVGQLVEGKLHWQGDSDAAITKGLLALLIEGLEGLEPAAAAAIEGGSNASAATGSTKKVKMEGNKVVIGGQAGQATSVVSSLDKFRKKKR